MDVHAAQQVSSWPKVTSFLKRTAIQRLANLLHFLLGGNSVGHCPEVSESIHHREALLEHFKELRENNSQPGLSYLATYFFKNEGNMKKSDKD